MSQSLTIDVQNVVKQNTPLRNVPSGSTSEPDYSVKYVAQTLTEEQQAQARANIGAAAAGESGGATINEFVYTRTGEPEAYNGVISCEGYEPKEGDLMTISFQGPFYTSYNPVTLNNGTTNPTVTLLNAEVNSTDYDEINPEVNTKWTVKLTKVNDAWVAVNISTQVQADWNTSDTTMPSYIKNKPTISSTPDGWNPDMDPRAMRIFIVSSWPANIATLQNTSVVGKNHYSRGYDSAGAEYFSNKFMDWYDTPQTSVALQSGMNIVRFSTNNYGGRFVNTNAEIWAWTSFIPCYANQLFTGTNSSGRLNIVVRYQDEYYNPYQQQGTGGTTIWYMNNKVSYLSSDGEPFADAVLFDAPMDMVNNFNLEEPTSQKIYVPKSRYAEFAARVNNNQYVLDATIQYDFISQCGWTLKMITLPTT